MDYKHNKKPRKSQHSFLVQRKQRISIADYGNVYIKNTQTQVRELYRRSKRSHNNNRNKYAVDHRSSSSCNTNILHASLQVEALNERIENEIDKLKNFRDSFLHEKHLEEASQKNSPMPLAEMTSDVQHRQHGRHSLKPSPPAICLVTSIHHKRISERQQSLQLKQEKHYDRLDAGCSRDLDDNFPCYPGYPCGYYTCDQHPCNCRVYHPCTRRQSVDDCYCYQLDQELPPAYAALDCYEYPHQPCCSSQCSHRCRTDLNTEDVCQYLNTLKENKKIRSHSRSKGRKAAGKKKESTRSPSQDTEKIMKVTVKKQQQQEPKQQQQRDKTKEPEQKILISSYKPAKKRQSQDEDAEFETMRMHREYMEMYKKEHEKTAVKLSSKTNSDLDIKPTYTKLPCDMASITHEFDNSYIRSEGNLGDITDMIRSAQNLRDVPCNEVTRQQQPCVQDGPKPLAAAQAAQQNDCEDCLSFYSQFVDPDMGQEEESFYSQQTNAASVRECQPASQRAVQCVCPHDPKYNEATILWNANRSKETLESLQTPCLETPKTGVQYTNSACGPDCSFHVPSMHSQYSQTMQQMHSLASHRLREMPTQTEASESSHRCPAAPVVAPDQLQKQQASKPVRPCPASAWTLSDLSQQQLQPSKVRQSPMASPAPVSGRPSIHSAMDLFPPKQQPCNQGRQVPQGPSRSTATASTWTLSNRSQQQQQQQQPGNMRQTLQNPIESVGATPAWTPSDLFQQQQPANVRRMLQDEFSDPDMREASENVKNIKIVYSTEMNVGGNKLKYVSSRQFHLPIASGSDKECDCASMEGNGSPGARGSLRGGDKQTNACRCDSSDLDINYSTQSNVQKVAFDMAGDNCSCSYSNRSAIDWEQLNALNATQGVDNDCTLEYNDISEGDNLLSTCRSSGSNEEFTCHDSSFYDDNDKYMSCAESPLDDEFATPPPFHGCQCMYENYIRLTSMCYGK